jgi:hypothetical protein
MLVGEVRFANKSLMTLECTGGTRCLMSVPLHINLSQNSIGPILGPYIACYPTVSGTS